MKCASSANNGVTRALRMQNYDEYQEAFFLHLAAHSRDIDARNFEVVYIFRAKGTPFGSFVSSALCRSVAPTLGSIYSLVVGFALCSTQILPIR